MTSLTNEHDWAGGWTERIIDNITSQGFDSVVAYVAQNRRSTVRELAARFEPKYAPIQLRMALYSEALRLGELRFMARYTLETELAYRFPNGYNSDTPINRLVVVFSSWVSHLEDFLSDESSRHAVASIRFALFDLLKRGWRSESELAGAVTGCFAEYWCCDPANQDSDAPSSSYLQAIQRSLRTLDIYLPANEVLKAFNLLTLQDRNLVASHYCVSESLNGGLEQYFRNSTGVLAPEAADGFGALGLRDAEMILNRAVDLFGAPYPREKDARIARIEQFVVELTRLTDELYDVLKLDKGELSAPEPSGFEIAANKYAKEHGLLPNVSD